MQFTTSLFVLLVSHFPKHLSPQTDFLLDMMETLQVSSFAEMQLVKEFAICIRTFTLPAFDTFYVSANYLESS